MVSALLSWVLLLLAAGGSEQGPSLVHVRPCLFKYVDSSSFSKALVYVEKVIEPDGPVPPYLQLVEILVERIERGDWQPNRPIPSELQLVQEFGIARGTVRRAVAVLRERELVFTVPQRGTYVSPSPSGATE